MDPITLGHGPVALAAQAVQQSDLTPWIAAGATVVAALIAAVVTLAVALGKSRADRRLEREKIEHANRLGIERDREADARKDAAERAKAAEAEAAKIDDHLKQEAAQANAQERQAIEYRRKVIGRLGKLKILDMSRSLELDRLYVQLRVREEEALRFVSDEDIVAAASGEPERMLRLSREHLRTRSVGALTSEDALSRFTRIVVLGDPGAGKTTMLRYLAFRAAREELDGVMLPVYVELRDFIDSGDPDLLTYAATDMDNRYGFSDAKSYIEQRFADGRAVLLLDGLDEVLGGESAEAATVAYRTVVSEAARLATRYPALRIAVTCRKAGWRHGLSQFQTLEVLDFDWPEIQTFVTNWFDATPAKAEGLCDALGKNMRMQTLAANPLLLSLIAIVYERELELPERRAELYNHCVEVLLKDWDAHREIKRFSLFTTDRKRDLLEEIAWHFHGAGLRYFPKDELLGIIREFLPTIDLDAEHAEAILKEIVAQYGLLKEQASGWYGFLHLTLQEYFTAQAASERGLAAIARIAAARHDPWWEEVILLLAGRMADASSLLLGILGREADSPEPSGDESLAVDDDLFCSDLLLAGRCLASRPRLRASWLREHLVKEAWRLLLASPYGDLRRPSALVIAEAGGPANRAKLLEHICDDAAVIQSRSSAAHALGEVSDPEIAAGLRTVLDRVPALPADVAGAVVSALTSLRDRKSVAALLRRIHSAVSAKGQPSSDESFLVSQCCIGLGMLGDASVKEEVWRIVEQWPHSTDRGMMLSGLIGVIGDLGDEKDVERLFSLSDDALFPAFRVAAEISGIAIVPRLIEMVADANSGFSRAVSAVYALRELPLADISEKVLRIIRDRRINEIVREVAVKLLGGDEKRWRPELVRLLTDPSIPDGVKVNAAAVLASWGDATGVPYLLASFEGEVDDIMDFSPMSTSAKGLGQLGDYSVLPKIIERYASGGPTSHGWTGALIDFKITESALPIVFDALESGKVDPLDWILPRKIRETAETADEAERLLRLFLGLGERERGEANEVYSALRTVSRRARVRVFADGRVVPISG